MYANTASVFKYFQKVKISATYHTLEVLSLISLIDDALVPKTNRIEEDDFDLGRPTHIDAYNLAEDTNELLIIKYYIISQTSLGTFPFS